MKVGDLVTLSAYGMQRKRADWIEDGDIGIIIKHMPAGMWPDNYIIRWARSDWGQVQRRWAFARENTRADLKYVR